MSRHRDIAPSRQTSTGIRLTLFLLLFATSLAVGQPAQAAPAGDGALAKIGQELQALYQAYRMAQERGQPLILADPTIHLVEDRVIVDAVASDGVEALKVRLVALGMQGAVTAGRIVSGQLPIAQIAAMAELPELRFARAAMSTTR
jgi:hypothetical protein